MTSTEENNLHKAMRNKELREHNKAKGHNEECDEKDYEEDYEGEAEFFDDYFDGEFLG
jgi:hypothetical protein